MKTWKEVPIEHQLLGYRVYNNLYSVDVDELNHRLELLDGLRDDEILVDIWFPITVINNGVDEESELAGFEPCNYSVFFSELDKLNKLNCPYWEVKELSTLISDYFSDNQKRDNWKKNEIDEIYFIPISDVKAQIKNVILKLSYQDNNDEGYFTVEQEAKRAELLTYLQSHIPIHRVSYRMACVAKAAIPLVYDGAISTFALSLLNQENEDAFLSYLSIGGARVDAHIQGDYPKEVIWFVCESSNGRVHYLCPLIYIKKQAELVFKDYADKDSVCLWCKNGVPSPVIQDEMYRFF